MIMDAIVESWAASAAPTPFMGLRRRYYGAIAIDPASRFKSYTAIQSQKSRRDNERHYRTMAFTALAALPIRDLAAPGGCHLFVWTSGPFLPQALKLIEAWRFKYSTRAFTWLKARRGWDGRAPLLELEDFPPGLGLTVRHQTEIVLLARRGNCRRLRKDIRELILAPRASTGASRTNSISASSGTARARTSICSHVNAGPDGTLTGMKWTNLVEETMREAQRRDGSVMLFGEDGDQDMVIVEPAGDRISRTGSACVRRAASTEPGARRERGPQPEAEGHPRGARARQ